MRHTRYTLEVALTLPAGGLTPEFIERLAIAIRGVEPAEVVTVRWAGEQLIRKEIARRMHERRMRIMGLIKKYELETAEREYNEYVRQLQEMYPQGEDPELEEQFRNLMEKDG